MKQTTYCSIAGHAGHRVWPEHSGDEQKVLEDILQMVVGSTLEFCFHLGNEINQYVRLHDLEKSQIPTSRFS